LKNFLQQLKEKYWQQFREICQKAARKILAAIDRKMPKSCGVSIEFSRTVNIGKIYFR
jgi:hypothetical protein